MALQGLGIAGATIIHTPASLASDEKSPQSTYSIPGASSIQPSPELSISNVPVQDFDPCVGAKPSSPFYRHATTSMSVEQLTWNTRRANRETSRMADPEAQKPQSPSQDSRLSKLWHRKRQPWELLHGLGRRQRIAIKVLIAVVVVGTMIGIALGIASSTAGGVWKYNRDQAVVRRRVC